MQLIQSVTVGAGGTSTIQFSSIPQSATDLVLFCSLRTDNSGDNNDLVAFRFNGSSASIYTMRRLQGTGGVVANEPLASSTSFQRWAINAALATSNTFANSFIYIPNYTSNLAKLTSIDSVTENNGANARQDIMTGRWDNTAAITSLSMSPINGTIFVQNSIVSLYSITKA